MNETVSLVLKYVAGGVILGMLFYLALVGKMPVDTFESLAVGALGAVCGHAVGVWGASDKGKGGAA